MNIETFLPKSFVYAVACFNIHGELDLTPWFREI